MRFLRVHRTGIRRTAFLWAMLAGPTWVTAQPLRVETAKIAGGGEIDGPAYDYRVGKFEVRNDEFIAFLNDAMANPDNERGQFVYVDTDTGDVYVNAAQLGEQGSGSGGRTVPIFAPAAAGQIVFVDGVFQIVTGAGVDYAAHPVTGVSWYGAVKFCNWLTVQIGIDSGQRCYTEAPSDDPGGWHPVTISHAGWALRDLSVSERETLATTFLGYRLAMDDGEAVTSAYNEWYKAAAYDPAAPDIVRTRPFGPDVAADHWIFAFGRDVLEPVDANVLNSGDPFEGLVPATTPTGFFDGISLLEDLTVTRDTDNPYGLYDLSGNVWEWVQDQGAATDRRRYRGGGWDLTGSFAENTFATTDRPGSTPNWVGFRVVQAELALDPEVTPDDTLVTQFTGPAGGPFSPQSIEYAIRSLSAESIHWEVVSDVAWLDIDGFLAASGTLDPFATVTIAVTLGPDADDLPVATHTALLAFLADGTLIAERSLELVATGPFVDVVPTTGLVSSGPAGGPFFPDSKTYTLSNNTEQQLPWQVTTDVDWLLINGGASAIGSLAPGLEQDVAITIDTPQLVQLPINQVHSAVVLFQDVASGASTTRTVVVGVGLSPLTIDMAIVPGDDPQPDGPSHSFRIGIHEVTNREFQGFLNDTLVSRSLPRGYWLYHDTDSGDVYLNGQQDGVVGTDGTGTVLFDASISDRITFDGTQYRVQENTEEEPVTGVTWYGALKFCNWLTLLQGIDASQLVYTEGPLPEDWHPVTISTADWQVRDLLDVERGDLVNNYAGFRLPMDGASTGAAPYNEWYKAAAWTHHTGGVDLLGNTTGATADGASLCDPESGVSDLWWTYIPAEDGDLRLELTFDPTNIHLFSVHTGCPATACNDIACHLDGPIQVAVEAGQTYWIRVAARGASTGPFTLTIDGPGCADGVGDESDDCLDATPVCPGELGINRLYGFGRDAIEGADANYWNSGDTESNIVTPVGWFDGIHVMADGTTPTRLSAGGYGLFDMCGNAAEWVQDQGNTPLTRATRGGSWQSIVTSSQLDNLTRTFDLPGAARRFAGFRIAQSQANAPIVVTPEEDVFISGPAGGPYGVDAGVLVYTMQAPGARLTSEYAVAADAAWVTLNGEGQSIRGVIEPPFVGQPDLTVDVEFEFNQEANALLPPADPRVEMQPIPAGHRQPDGPDYSFRMARYETTNEAFAEFLNDALANPSNARGQYLYFDTETGDVFVNDVATGATGAGASGRTLRIFNAVVNPHIPYDSEVDTYSLEPGYERHPVTGVTWFGALKYCNWLTVRDGLGTAQRAYTEGPNAGDWRPVTVSSCNWWGMEDTAGAPAPLTSARDLNDEERANLVNSIRGYRLPMDGDSTIAGPFNEWYKCAAWDNGFGVNHVYGFGREGPIAASDANYLASGDPYEPGTTPAGFFEGTLYNPGGGTVGDGSEFQTNADTNPYGFFDLAGNVAEWVQDRGDLPAEHAARGGSWQDDPDTGALDVSVRRSLVASESYPFVGFRVVQAALDHRAAVRFDDVTTGSSTDRELRLLLHEPMHVDDPDGFDAGGMFGGPFADNGKVYTLTSESETPMDWEVTVSQTGTRWLDINGGASDSGQLTDVLEGVVTVQTNAAALTLSPGEYMATVRIENQTTGYFEARECTLTISEPLHVAPESWDILSVWGTPVDPPLTTAFDMTNLSDRDLGYAVTVNAEWITLDEGDPVSGTLEPLATNGQIVRVSAATDSAADTLPIGVHTATISFRNVTAASTVVREVNLDVQDPLRITPKAAQSDGPDSEWRGPVGGPFTEVTAQTTIDNIGEVIVFYEINVDAGQWIDLGGVTQLSGDLLPGESDTIPLSLTALSNVLGAGGHPVDVSFTDLTTGHVQTHTAVLTVEGDLAVTPVGDLMISGREGGPIRNTPQTYTLRNMGAADVTWTATSVPAAGWVAIDQGTSAGGSLSIGASVDVVVGIDSVAAVGLPAGVHETDVVFDTGVGQPVRRHVMLTIIRATVDIAEATVPAADAQPGGPSYDFRMAVYPTTNGEFAAFLNDARANVENERGAYLYFDLDSGDVYIHTAMEGQEGTAAPSAILNTLVYDASVGRIGFVNNAFVVEAGFDDHPVVGVSWFGAIKYANWLTLDHGMGAQSRCYTEAVSGNLDGWHPISITTANWANRPLTDAERGDLVTNCFGFRLPMDHQTGQASAYNEWYKAAAWDSSAGGGMGANHVYGFGRDVITGADANFRCSEDIFEDATDCTLGGTTPAGYYNGTNTRADGSPTSDTFNAFALYDMTGNVFHWMQGRYSGSTTILGNRTVRGGGWNSPIDSPLLVATGRTHTPADHASDLIGFRVMRTLLAASGDGNGDGVVDQADLAVMLAALTGPGISVLPEVEVFDFNGDGDIDLADFAAFQRMMSVPGP